MTTQPLSRQTTTARVASDAEPRGAPTERSALVSTAASSRGSLVGARPADASAAPPARKVIGVMGGMGPAAANAFGQKLIALRSAAKSDQEHARVLLDQATDIPDRTAAIAAGGRSPVPEMTASLRRLARGGADVVAITCNTAHHFFDDMQRTIDRFGLQVDLMHIVDATMSELHRQAPQARKVGLLATDGTLGSRIYQDRAKQQGHHHIGFIEPDEGTQRTGVMKGIYEGVKAGRLEQGRADLLRAAEHLRDQGADAILLACTEIPLVLKTGDVSRHDGTALPMIDTLEALARQSLERTEGHRHGDAPVVTRHGCFQVAAAGLDAFVHSASNLIAAPSERPRLIGVMGGMGPGAAMGFAERMVKLIEEESQRAPGRVQAPLTDQDHVRLILDQATDVPDRTGYIQNRQGANPSVEMIKSLDRLAAAGADSVVITCNTAHHFFPEVQAAIERDHPGLDLIHIVDATMELLDRQVPHARSIGLLATDGTCNSKVYQNRTHELDQGTGKQRTWTLPDAGLQQKVMDGIYQGVKAGDLERGREKLLEAAQVLAHNGADAILLACTEIPLVLKTGDVKNSRGESVPLIDTLEAQARKAIARSRTPVPQTPGLVTQVRQLLAQDEARGNQVAGHLAPA